MGTDPLQRAFLGDFPLHLLPPLFLSNKENQAKKNNIKINQSSHQSKTEVNSPSAISFPCRLRRRDMPLTSLRLTIFSSSLRLTISLPRRLRCRDILFLVAEPRRRFLDTLSPFQFLPLVSIKAKVKENNFPYKSVFNIYNN